MQSMKSSTSQVLHLAQYRVKDKTLPNVNGQPSRHRCDLAIEQDAALWCTVRRKRKLHDVAPQRALRGTCTMVRAIWHPGTSNLHQEVIGTTL